VLVAAEARFAGRKKAVHEGRAVEGAALDH